jgi:hypothetical protein
LEVKAQRYGARRHTLCSARLRCVC